MYQGQILKDDIRMWSRKLHNHVPPNLYAKSRVPRKTICMGLLFFILGILFITLATLESIHNKSIRETYLKIIAGIIIFIPGFYLILIAFLMHCCGYEKKYGFRYEDIA